MPLGLNYYPTAVLLKGKVYVGGGGGSMMGHYVTVYDIEKDNWIIMPPYSFYWFSLAALNDQLVLVGGVGPSNDRTGILGVWEDKVSPTTRWTHPFPPMPTARSGAMVLTWRNRWLIVAGGYNEDAGSLSEVEIFDISTSEWYHGSPLPMPAYKMSSAVIKNTWYLLGGHSITFVDHCFSIDLNDLIVHSISETNLHSCPLQWLSIPTPPVCMSAALAINERLLSLGGSPNESTIYIYQPKSQVWISIGELPLARQEFVCVVLPNGKLLVVGGEPDSEKVDIGTLIL